jgi:lysozyme
MINTYSQAAVDIIKFFEGCQLTSYWDKNGGCYTIGYGHTGADVYENLSITQSEAEEMLKSDMDKFVIILNRNVSNENITQSQYDALESFIFNIGAGKKDVKSGLITLKNGNHSTLLNCVNNNDVQGAAQQFLRWASAGGVTLSGLLKRRIAEQKLFLGKDWK